jgi:uncharacterized protein
VGRIHAHYGCRFRALLGQRGAADIEREVAALFASACEQNTREKISLTFVWARQHADLVRQTGASKNFPHRFTCDAGLGGLARWLRGSGYEAFWNPDLGDAAVIRDAQRRNTTLVTTDSLMMERGVLRDGLVPSVFVPSTLTCKHQLEIVFRELGLTPRESRCMSCGGELRRVGKNSVAERIPPRTARWLDEYFVCAECGQLFWKGTHWQRIQQRLGRL